jgi:OOP family OmpA-OmpF porin
MTAPREAGPNRAERERRAQSGIDALRAILVGTEQQRIEQLRAHIEDPAVRAREVAEVLPQAMRLRHHLDEDLTRALEQPLAGSIRRTVQRDPEAFAEALFPVMGPAIRRAIAEALRGLVQNINRTLDHSLSLRGLRWRWEAMRSGVPFAEVVLRHTLAYRVEQVFLIRPDDGLLVEHVTDELALPRDADAVSAMLTAIQSFVRDAFASDDPIEAVDMGEHTVWLLHGPRAYLACVIRGVPPWQLRAEFDALLRDIHTRYGEALAEFAGDRDQLPDLRAELAACLVSEHKEEQGRARRLSTPLLLAVAGILALLGWLAQQQWQGHQAREAERAAQHRAVTLLEGTPGLVLTEVEPRPGRLMVSGLRDPLASEPAAVIAPVGLDPASISMHWRPYESAEPELALARAHARLEPPQQVSLQLVDGDRLVAAGVAPDAWIARATLLAPTVPGIAGLDATRLETPDQVLERAARQRIDPPAGVRLQAVDGALRLIGSAPAAWIDTVATRLAGTAYLKRLDLSALDADERAELAAMRARIEAVKIYFADGVEPKPGQADRLEALAQEVARLPALATALDLRGELSVIGRTDGIGLPEDNAVLAQGRAARIVAELTAAGVPAGLLRAQAEPARERANTPREELRRVDFQLELLPSGSD